MVREYLKGNSRRLGREMELLLFGRAGLPILALPTSGGRFFELEDRGIVAALAEKIEDGRLQLFCVDSVDMESWYNKRLPPRARIERHLQYESYLLEEVVPLIRRKNPSSRILSFGCSLGGYHAVNVALRHPHVFAGAVSLSGAFDLSRFLEGYMDEDCYLNLPTYYLPNLCDARFLHRLRRNSYILATGWDDQCLEQNRNLDRIMNEKAIPHRFHIWDAQNSHDWPTWQSMAREYL